MSEKSKMGMHNRITAERYHQIKAELHSAQDDKRAMEKYNIGTTTARLIRNTSNFYEYRLRTDPNLRKMRHKPLKVIAPSSGLYFEDYRPKRTTIHTKKQADDHKASDQLDLEAERIATVVGVLLSIICLVSVIVIFVALILLTGGA